MFNMVFVFVAMGVLIGTYQNCYEGYRGKSTTMLVDSVDDDFPDPPTLPTGPIGGDRPVSVHVPPSYVKGKPMPLVMMLHGYTATGPQTEAGFKFAKLADSRGFLYVYPTGPTDKNGKPFWFATDACCDFFDYQPKIDDSTYLSNLIKEISARYTVDPKRVFILGLSAGGWMAHRMACDHGDQIAAIVSVAGATWSDPARCAAKYPVNVLQVHGSLDDIVPVNGGQFGSGYCPSLADTVGSWVKFNNCNPTVNLSPTKLDLDTVIAGNETTISSYANCSAGGHVELWTIEGVGHNLKQTATFNEQVIDFLLAHPKP